MPSSPDFRKIQETRVGRRTEAGEERAIALSLVDATTLNFSACSSIWLFERPTTRPIGSSTLADHLRDALGVSLKAYPYWCGHMKTIDSIDGNVPLEAEAFEAHARRYGRVYVHFGTADDPGASFTAATSSATLDSVFERGSLDKQPKWSRQDNWGEMFLPSCELWHNKRRDKCDDAGLLAPLMALQCTELACGGVVIGVKIAHPLADITSLTEFVQAWASVSRAVFAGDQEPILSSNFDPRQLDILAAGEINAAQADPTVLKAAEALPLHRFDWWAPPANPPDVFPDQDMPLAGKAMPWETWDGDAPVSTYTIHLSREQIEFLWREATKPNSSTGPRISRHDAILAHIWSCIVRARGLDQDEGPVHCDLTLGIRPLLHLDPTFVGSPVMMVNIEVKGKDHAAPSTAPSGQTDASNVGLVSQRIRETIAYMSNPSRMATHIYSIAYEKSPQRLWLGFLGDRHILVTTWARAGLYEVDFGFGSRIRYVDGVFPQLDGLIVLKEGPPTAPRSRNGTAWTDDGVDVTIPLRTEVMERFLQDPRLLPDV